MLAHLDLPPLELEFSIKKLDDCATLHRDLLLLIALHNTYYKKVIQKVLIRVLAAEDVDLVVDDLCRVAVPSGGYVALLLALEPLKHLEMPSPPLQIKDITHIAIFIVFYLALRLVDFFVQPNQNECIAEARVPLIVAAMHKHLVPVNQDADVAFPRRRLLSFVENGIQLGPHPLIYVVFEEVVEGALFRAAAENEDLIHKCYARVRVSRLRRLNLNFLPLEEIVSAALELKLAFVEGMEGLLAASCPVMASEDV